MKYLLYFALVFMGWTLHNLVTQGNRIYVDHKLKELEEKYQQRYDNCIYMVLTNDLP